MRIAILGSGALARALAPPLRGAGHDVVLSGRSLTPPIVSFAEAASWGELVVVAVPFSATADLLPGLAPQLRGKIVVDATNPLGPDWGPLDPGPAPSAAEAIASLLPGARLVKAFNRIFADVLATPRLDRGGRRITAFIAGDDAASVAQVASLAQELGLAPLVTGLLRTARHLEHMAHLNIALAVGQGGGTNAAFLYDRAVG